MFIDFKKADQKGWDLVRKNAEEIKDADDLYLGDLDEYRTEAVLMIYQGFTEDEKKLFYEIPYQLEEDAADSSKLYESVYRLSYDDQISVERLYVHYFNMFNTFYFETLQSALDMMPYDKLNDRDKAIVDSMKNTGLTLHERFQAIMQFSELFGTCKYKIDELSFEFKGETFYIQQEDIIRHYAKQGYKAGEVIARNEIKKEYRDRIKRLGDTEGLYEMELSAKEMAILCRKKDESLPYYRVPQKKFINERADFFNEIPMLTYYSVVFFWILTWLRSDMIQLTELFLQTFTKELGVNPKTPKIDLRKA